MPLNVTGSLKWRKPRPKGRAQMPMLPGDVGILRKLEDQRKRDREAVEKLENTGPAFPAGQASPDTDLLVAMNSILARMFIPIPDKGVYYKVAADVHQFRQRCPPIVTANQLYGIFPNDMTTIDKEIIAARKAGLVRLITTNLSDTNDLLINAETYYSMSGNETFIQLLKANPESTWIKKGDLLDVVDPEQLVSEGFLTLDPSRPGIYMLSIPGQGSYLKLLQNARSWLLKVLSSNRKWRELPENIVQERLDQGKNYWRNLQGISLEWILYECIGGGWIEGFNTPIGRGWKVLRLS